MFANLTPVLWLHFGAACLTLVIGVVQLVAPKGTRGHRRAGWIYTAAMLLVILGALSSYRLGFGVFHVLALVSLFSLGMGLRAVRRFQRTGAPEWLRRHRIDMGFSYLGLVMAGISQIAVNPRFGVVGAMSPLAFWSLFTAINLAMYAVGSWLIFRGAGPAPGEPG